MIPPNPAKPPECSAKPIFRRDLCRPLNDLQIRTVEDQLKVGAAAVSAGMADKVESYAMAMNALQLELRSPSPARAWASSNHQRLAALSPDRQNQERLNRLRLEGLRQAR